MKLTQTVSITPEEVTRMLTKFVEKKLGKKVIETGIEEGIYKFVLEPQEVEDKKEG